MQILANLFLSFSSVLIMAANSFRSLRSVSLSTREYVRIGPPTIIRTKQYARPFFDHPPGIGGTPLEKLKQYYLDNGHKHERSGNENPR